MDLYSLLPAPVNKVWDREDAERAAKLQERPVSALVKASTAAPPYGQRKGWIPRNEDDFGDGGAFPEIQVAQYPLDMGMKGKESTSNALAIQLDSQGKIKYDLIARQGHAKDKIVYSKLSDLLPKQFSSEDDELLQKPSEEIADETTERTKAALEKIINKKISAAMPIKSAQKLAPAQYIRYTPTQQGETYNSGAKQRIIKVVEAQVDPMEPPRFNTTKKVPRSAPSPPAPVMHSPTRKVTAKEQKEWKIPPCISNWKNSKGYTIPLDKRLAADGRGLQQVHLNENFAKLAEALYIADRKARDAVEMRAQLEKKLAQKEKEKKEDHLRQLAEKARNDRSHVKVIAALDKSEDSKDRDLMRQERHKERARERNLARAGFERRSKIERQRERDISEQIALGLPAKAVNNTGETMFDARLFNSTKGMDSGYGDDEEYNVYDKPWRDVNAIGNQIYRPSKNLDKETYGEDIEKLKSTSRFVPDKEFSGTDRSGPGRSGPVQFEKDEEDPFGLDQFLKQAKHADVKTVTTGTKRKDDDRDQRKEKSTKNIKWEATKRKKAQNFF